MKRKSFFKLCCITIFQLLLFVSCIGNKGDAEKEIASQNPEDWHTHFGENGKIGYEDDNGNVMIDYQFGIANNFKNGLAEVTFDGFSGERFLINPNGERVSETFRSLIDNGEGIPLVAHKGLRDSATCFLIDRKGKTISAHFKRIDYVEEQSVFIAEIPCDSCYTYDSQEALLNFNGEIISDWYIRFNPFLKEDFLVVYKGPFGAQQEAAINNKGKIISDWYSLIYDLKGSIGNYRITAIDEGWNNKGVINDSGAVVLAPSYYQIDCFPSHGIVIGTLKDGFDEKYDVLTEKFVKVSKSKLPIYTPDASQLIGISSSNAAYAYYKMDGDTLKTVTPTYQMESKVVSGTTPRFFIFKERSYTKNVYWIPEFSDGLARVKKGGKYGFINTEGKLVIEHLYKDAADFQGGKCGVKRNGESFQIDKNGARIEGKIIE